MIPPVTILLPVRCPAASCLFHNDFICPLSYHKNISHIKKYLLPVSYSFHFFHKLFS